MNAIIPITIHEAKTNLSRLVKRAAAGETIYIGAYGKPEAVLTAVDFGKYKAELRKGFFGCMKGKIELREGWDDPLPDDIIESFYSMKGFEEWEKK
jgi:prevent-host-death family protein